MANTITSLCGLIGVLLFVTATIVGGLQIEGYDPIGQYISETYATGIPFSSYLQYAFMASGSLLFAFGLMAPWAFPKSRGLKRGFVPFALFYGLGTFVAGFFPCDPGCPSDSVDLSISQFIHNISGVLAYITVPFCLIGLGISFSKLPKTQRLGRWSMALGFLALVFMLLLLGNPSGPYKGLFQRVVETSVLLWVILTSLHLPKGEKGERSGRSKPK